MSPKVNKPTFSFSDGMLQISTIPSDMRLKWNPSPVGEERRHNGRWEAFRPEFRLLAPEVANPDDGADEDDQRFLAAKRDAFVAFRAEIPVDMAAAVEAFTSHQWALLMLLHGSKSGMDLVRSNPVLAYAVANNEHFRPTPLDAATYQAVRYSHKKQRVIVGWLGFPATEAMVRIIRRVPAKCASPGLLRTLRSVASDPDAVKLLGHVGTVNRGVIWLLSSPGQARLVTPALLREVSESSEEMDEAPTADLLMDSIRMAGEMKTTVVVRPLSSRRRVRECYDRITAAYRDAAVRQRLEAEQLEERQRQAAEAYRERLRQAAEQNRRYLANAEREEKMLESAPFPPPPIPGTKYIIPLTTRAALSVEGHEQSNCVGGHSDYVRGILKGWTYLYAVMRPQRHTLSIVKHGPNCWRIGELKRARNWSATPETRAFVEAWLNARQVSL